MIHSPVRIQRKHGNEMEGSKRPETRKTGNLRDSLFKFTTLRTGKLIQIFCNMIFMISRDIYL